MESTHPFAVIAGTWRGRGAGSYPTIEDFAYTEELVVEPISARPLAHWRSRTRDAVTAEPRHAESGFLRATPAGIELVVAHGFGIVEAASGSLDHGLLALTSDGPHGTPTAKRVDRVERRYSFDDDEVSYTVSMAAVGIPLTHHLRATLQRADEPSS